MLSISTVLAILAAYRPVFDFVTDAYSVWAERALVISSPRPGEYYPLGAIVILLVLPRHAAGCYRWP